MRILSLSTHGEKCGIATYNDSLTQALRDQGHIVDISPVDTAVARAQNKSDMLSYYDGFIAKIREYDAVIVQHEYGFMTGKHSTGFGQKVFAKFVRQLGVCGKPAAIIFHSQPKTSTRLLSFRRYYWERIRDALNANRKILSVVHGDVARKQYKDAGLDEGFIWSTRHPLRSPTPLPAKAADGIVTLTIFGFVSRYKGYGEAVEALQYLPENYRLVIAGGPHPRNARDMTFETIKALNHPRIEMTGWLEDADIPAVMARTDIVLAPYHETGPAGSGAVTWGIAYGRPVIATETLTFQDIQRETECFALVPPRNAKALAAMILEVANNPSKRDDLCARGLAYAARYSWAGMARELAARLSAL